MEQKRPLTTDERVERGLAQLGEDAWNLVHGKHLRKLNSHNQESTSIETAENQSGNKGVPFVQNIINNYTNRTESPTQIRKFKFIDVVKIIFCIVVIVVVVKILFDPQWFVDGFDSIVRFFHSF